MKPSEIRDMEESELQQKLKDLRVDLFNLRFQLATGQLDNPNRISLVKRDIARVQTEMRARELEVAREASS